MTSRFVKLGIVTVALLSAGLSHADPGYSFTDLGTLGGQFSRANAINNAGQIAGYSYLAGDPMNTPFHAVLWQGTTTTDLGTLGGQNSEARAINAAGQIAGVAYLTNGARHATVWTGSTTTDLGTLAGPGGFVSDAYGINQAGTVVGQSISSSGFDATLWNGPAATNLTAQTGLVIASGINDSGQIAGMGYAWNGATSTFAATAARMTGTTLTYLDRLRGADNYANAINNAGQVVGYTDDRIATQHAVLWNGTTATDLGTLVGSLSRANAINTAGQIVGNYYLNAGTYLARQRAVMWTWNGSTAVAVDLNTYLTDAEIQDGWELQTALGINDHGWIVGNAINHKLGGNHAYLLSMPVAVPEPQTSAMLLAGLALVGGLARRRTSPSKAG